MSTLQQIMSGFTTLVQYSAKLFKKQKYTHTNLHELATLMMSPKVHTIRLQMQPVCGVAYCRRLPTSLERTAVKDLVCTYKCMKEGTYMCCV